VFELRKLLKGSPIIFCDTQNVKDRQRHEELWVAVSQTHEQDPGRAIPRGLGRRLRLEYPQKIRNQICIECHKGMPNVPPQ
jgi:hypothetical protein